MPIHLPAISRRQFLVRSLAGGAALALAPELFAATKRSDPDSWALLSDIHLSADASMVQRGISMTDHFGCVTRELLALRKRPAGVFITGDCAYNSGQLADYAQLARLLQPLRQGQIPVCIALGNHDNRERFWEAQEEERAAKRPLADKQVALVRTPRANWFVLDSLEKTLSTPGLLGQAQLDWLARSLDANRDKPALVLAHHNPGTMASVSGLKDTEALLAVIRPRKQVKAYIFGHTHAWHVEQDPSGIHLITLPPVAYVFRRDDPAGWVHATLKRNGIRLELRCVDATHIAHGQVIKLQWRPA
ncbi:MAG TPA: metallophosphoesterase [Verrucomicrobiota bacterium]|jgi:3',5'-cyclic AMP phosphodiesterase CpdA|nr:metallophosphoesterase [Verrucomicrobiota bacterium]HQL78656.1 metallophosphoesterase [Verrucomicrobiota bacterium]